MFSKIKKFFSKPQQKQQAKADSPVMGVSAKTAHSSPVKYSSGNAGSRTNYTPTTYYDSPSTSCGGYDYGSSDSGCSSSSDGGSSCSCD